MYTGVECRRGAVVEVLWPMNRAVDGGEGQPGLTEETGVDGILGLTAGEEVTGVGRRLGPSEGRGRNGVQDQSVEAGIFPRVEF